MRSELPLDDVLLGFLNEVSRLAAPSTPSAPSAPSAPSTPRVPSSQSAQSPTSAPSILDAPAAAAAPATSARSATPATPATVRVSPDKAASPAARPAAEPSEQQRAALLNSLEAVGRSSRMLIWLWVALIIGVFVLIVGLTVYHRDKLAFVAGAILGGSGAMAALLQQVRGVHTRLVSTQLLLSLLPTLAPAQWRTAVQSLLEEVLNKPVRGR